jgi:signal transduction histidine kinase
MVWAVAVSVVLWVVVRHEVDELMDNTLQESAEILAGLLRFRDDFGAKLASGVLPQTPHDERLVWQLVDERNQVLIKSHIAPAAPLAPTYAQGYSEFTSGWRVFSMRLADRGPTLHVAQSQAERFEARTEAVLFAVAAALLVSAISALWMRSRVRTELEPLSTLADRIAAFGIDSPSPDLPPPKREELATVRDAIVALAGRLEQRIESERAFTAHAAHALRTPLAAIVAQLAVAQNLASPDVRPHLIDSRIAAHRLGNVVCALMTLSRAGEAIRPRRVELRALVQQLPVHERLMVKVTSHDRLIADPDLLAAVLLNLFDNSAKHGASDVEVIHVRVNGIDRLVVQDNGSGGGDIAPSQHVPRPGDDSLASGGLGLALATLVAKAHGGEAFVAPAQAGFRVELRWPRLAVSGNLTTFP